MSTWKHSRKSLFFRVVKCTINDHFMHYNTRIKHEVPYLNIFYNVVYWFHSTFIFMLCLFLEALRMFLYEKARRKYRVVKCKINDHFMHYNTRIKHKVPYLNIFYNVVVSVSFNFYVYVHKLSLENAWFCTRKQVKPEKISNAFCLETKIRRFFPKWPRAAAAIPPTPIAACVPTPGTVVLPWRAQGHRSYSTSYGRKRNR